MNIELPGTAGPSGWPASDCRCASCARLRAAGVRYAPFRAVLDGVPLDACAHDRVPGGLDVRAPGGARVLVADHGGRPEPRAVYDAALLDAALPDHLGRLRNAGALKPDARVVPIHLDHRLRSPEELERRLPWWLDPVEGPHRTLLLGGTRSGKSAEAELRLTGCPDVTYLATSAPRDDPEWGARVRAHRLRRPSWWRTVETIGLPEALAAAEGAVLVDGIGTWLTAAIDEAGAWDDPYSIGPRLEELLGAWRATPARVVAVSDEVGLSLVPTTASGRAFRDLLGDLNQRLAAESEEAALVVAGRVLELP